MAEASERIASPQAAGKADPEASHALGLGALKAGRLDEAIRHLQAAVAAAPEVAAYHANLGSALQRAGKLDPAIDALQRAAALLPDHPAVHHNIGNALLAARRADEAAAAQARAAALAPGEARFRYAWGLALDRAHRLIEAEERYREALALDPAQGSSRIALALLRLAAGDRDEALILLRDQHRRMRAPVRDRPYDDASRLANRGKVRHDLEQLRWLQGQGVATAAAAALIPAYERLLASMPDGADLQRPVALSDAALAALGGAYNRLIHVMDAPAIEGGALAPRDWSGVETSYFADAPGITWIDGFLTDEAVAALRGFCLGSTIFHHAKHGGYVGAYLPEVASGLLLQIAAELPRRMPGVFRHHRLRQMWVYKYDSRMEGIGLHADSAAVNVNFWLTPESANLDPDSGGLVIHRCEAPLDWSFRSFNEDETAIADYIRTHSHGTMTVPYRFNRAIIFHSDLFHATDRFRFRDRYEDRRLNVTMLFGDRAEEGG